MTQALPLWCCLNSKSRLAVMAVLARLGSKTFHEPQPIWQDWKPGTIIFEDIDYAKFMRRRPHSPKRIA